MEGAPLIKRQKIEAGDQIGMSKLTWDFPVNLIGEKVNDPDLLNCCEICGLPILNYGRMIPCKHVFCTGCAKLSPKVCARCGDPTTRIEECSLGTVFVCAHGAQRHAPGGCKRTYLSYRDMEAHIKHRHRKTEKKAIVSTAQQPSMPDLSQPPPAAYPSTRLPPSGHTNPGPSPHSRAPNRSIPIVQSGHGNLISIPIQGESAQPEFQEFSGNWRGQYPGHRGGWQGRGGHRGMAQPHHRHPRPYN